MLIYDWILDILDMQAQKIQMQREKIMERRANYTKNSARGKKITNIVIILYVTVKLHSKTIKKFSMISHKVSIFYMLNIFFPLRNLSP